MKWWIGIGIYKMKSGNYFVLNIPDEMEQVGYNSECYEEDSVILGKNEIHKLNNEEYGYYTLKLVPEDKGITYKEVIESAKRGRWYSFVIEEYVKRI